MTRIMRIEISRLLAIPTPAVLILVLLVPQRAAAQDLPPPGCEAIPKPEDIRLGPLPQSDDLHRRPLTAKARRGVSRLVQRRRGHLLGTP
jgi:hypothetical protein